MFDSRRSKSLMSALVVAFAAIAGGCSAGDVELNGSLFDKLGVGSGAQVANRSPKLADRQNLVLPPNLERLPVPGSGAAEEVQSTEAMPVNPEQKRVATAGQAEKNHKAFCEKAMQQAKVKGDLSPVNGPLGRCDASILDAINFQSPVEVTTGSTPAKKP